MEEYFDILSRNPLFAGISSEERVSMMGCLGTTVVTIPKGEPVFLEGDQAGFLGLVLEGSIQIVHDDYYGNRSVLTHAGVGAIVAEAYACANVDTMPVRGYALQGCKVMLFACKKMLTVCSNACRFHNQLVKNLQLLVMEILRYAVLVVYVSVGTGDNNNLTAQLGDLGNGTPCHVTEARERNSLSSDVLSGHLEHLL